jgi:hypothetical protein
LAGTDFASALALLLSSSELRLRLRMDPAALAAELALDPAVQAQLAGLSLDGLEAQARILLAKRRSEVARIAARSWKRLGAAASASFAEYAESNWPEGHLRHSLDALGFLRWLGLRHLPHSRVELLRLETRLSQRCGRVALVPSSHAWQLPGLYIAKRTARGWYDCVLHLGPWRD